MNKLQQKTGAACRKFIIDLLDHVADDDAYQDKVTELCDELGKIDTGALDVDLLVNDPKVQAAFKKFVSAQIGAFQVMEEEFGGNPDD